MSYFIIFSIGIYFGFLATAITYRFIVEEDLFVPFQCPVCNHKLHKTDLIPLISYFLISRTFCRYCHKKISRIYPTVEIISGILFLITFAKYGLSMKFIFVTLCLYIVFICVVIDIETLTVPDIFLYLLLLLSIIFACLYLENTILSLSLSLSIFFLLIVIEKIVTRLLHRQSLGFGDVILIPVLTNFLSPNLVPYFIIMSGVFGILFGIIWRFCLFMGNRFPFIPPIFLSLFLCIFFGN